MITMAEIARLTEVSQSTVFKVLNGSRICLLAVIVPDISNPFFADIIKKLEHEVEKEGRQIPNISDLFRVYRNSRLI